MDRDWPALKSDLTSVLQVEAEEPGGFVGRTSGGEQVVVEFSRGLAIEWLVLRTPICAQGEMDSELVLERNGQLAFSVIVLVNGLYWLRLAMPFDSVELRDVKVLVALLVQAARSVWPYRIEQHPPRKLFAHYTDG